jgi:hypothetical protein
MPCPLRLSSHGEKESSKAQAFPKNVIECKMRVLILSATFV